MAQKFYICEHCGNVITFLENRGVPVVCCGQEMTELIPGKMDAAVEKHVPVYTVSDGVVSVSVGEVAHPMIPEHYIEWLWLQTRQGAQLKRLHPGDPPEASFLIAHEDQVESVLAYCNLHGLWEG